MLNATCRSVDEYIASQPEAAQAALARVRDAIRGAIPEVEETISYNMPTYKLGGRAIIYFAGWKQHYSVYPASSALIAAFDLDLTPYKIEKSTIKFSFSAPVPVELIGRIAKFRAEEIGQCSE